MKTASWIVCLWLSLMLLAVDNGFTEEGGLSPHQKGEIQKIIQEYLISHPEIILESVQRYREKQEAERREQGANNLQARRQDLELDPSSPVVGNPNGDVTIVEFFDYNCGYCKLVLVTVQELLSEDRGVRLVLKEYPILSDGSEFAARAALAAREQGRYFDFHNSLMRRSGQINKEEVLEVATQVGLDLNQLQSDLSSSNVTRQIEENRELAQSLNINGTPTFVIGDTILPGAVDGEILRSLIASVRNGG